MTPKPGTDRQLSEAFFGMPIVTSPHVPAGQILIFDRTIWTSLTVDQVVVKFMVADMAKRLRAHLAELVAAAESRLGLSVLGVGGLGSE